MSQQEVLGILQKEKRALTVTEIKEFTDISISTISMNLQRLMKSKFVGYKDSATTVMRRRYFALEQPNDDIL